MQYSEKLARRLPGCRPILDGNLIHCAVSGSTSPIRYLKSLHPYKLRSLDGVFVGNSLNSFSNVATLLRRSKPFVLPEVIHEVGAFSANLSLLANKYHEKVLLARVEVPNAFNGVYEQGLNNLQLVAHRANRVWDLLAKSQFQINWTRGLASEALKFALDHSRDVDARTLEHYGLDIEYDEMPVGIRIHTDQKLAVLGYLSAFEEDVVLVTRDQGVLDIANRLKPFFNSRSKDARPSYGYWGYNVRHGSLECFNEPSAERSQLLTSTGSVA